MKTQPHFHNTIGATQPELALYQDKALKQDVAILKIFTDRPGKWLTPFHVQSIMNALTGLSVPITSVRRGITNLTKEGKLLKSGLPSGKGIYKRANYVWTVAI